MNYDPSYFCSGCNDWVPNDYCTIHNCRTTHVLDFIIGDTKNKTYQEIEQETAHFDIKSLRCEICGQYTGKVIEKCPRCSGSIIGYASTFGTQHMGGKVPFAVFKKEMKVVI